MIVQGRYERKLGGVQYAAGGRDQLQNSNENGTLVSPLEHLLFIYFEHLHNVLVNLFVSATVYPRRASGQVCVVRAAAAVQCGHGEIPEGGSQAGVAVAGQTPVRSPGEEAVEGPGQPGVGEQHQHLEPPQHHQRPGILQQAACSA